MNRLEELVQYSSSTNRQASCGDSPVAAEKRGETARMSPLQRLAAWGVVAAVGSVFAFSVSPAAAAPCANHVGAAKAACVKQYRRSHEAYPKPDPTWREFLNRSTPYEQRTLHAIANCEEPFSHGGPGWRDVAWGFQGGTYSTFAGMANSTVTIGESITGYRWPTSNHAEEAFLALAVMRQYGPSAWGCGRGL